VKSDKFPPTSRYHDAEVAQLVLPDGRTIAYLRRRFIPPAESFALLREHAVRAGDRLDQIAATYLGDPEQFWRVADANGAIAPEELTDVVGRRLRITLPAGVPGPDDGGALG
jgi:hypothetical protein